VSGKKRKKGEREKNVPLFETSAKTSRRRRKRLDAECETEAAADMAARHDMLASIVTEGRDEDESPRAPVPDMERGGRYKIRDECVDGTFELCDIVAGRAVLYVFKNVETGTKTTYTPHALTEFNRGGAKSGVLKRVDR